MSRKLKEDYYRFFSVTDPRTHEKGHTEYKVTARFVSKRHPDDVKEVVVWRRFSELKKLHGELAYTHRNLFRREEEFPPFPRAQLFGRFDGAVIEERRKAAEAMLQFTTSIPALYNSPQLKEFFRFPPVPSPFTDPESKETQEEFDSLFDSVAEGLPSPKEEVPPPLSDNDLAVFDPCYKQDRSNSSTDHSELFSLPSNSVDGEDGGYLNQAAKELTAAMEREKEGEISSAICGYRMAVDILITGVQGDTDPVRRESVMRRTAQYLKHAEMLVERHSSPSHSHTPAQDH
ncbi:sorting nexin-15 [Neolamprologus brichardi]|uniref:sorting nexin-15 n=1 Tax=Neolamprologus brichardi TaxID=32507 RepID=UPI001643AD93|nr:sorting nexin-15 [Neolamprologus brichardi]